MIEPSYGRVPEPAGHRLPSERVVVAAPMSFAGSAERLWAITRYGPAGGGWGAGALIALIYTGVILGIVVAWAVVLCWYLLFGLLLVPYRIIRRGQRKRRREELRHREMLGAIERSRP